MTSMKMREVLGVDCRTLQRAAQMFRTRDSGLN